MAVEAVFGGNTVWHCELDPAASKVLAHRWPGVPNLGDISKVDWTAVEPVGILCGGFPCQDVSAAGRRAGIREDTRSGLWLEFANAIAALQPRLVVVENVRGLLSGYAYRAVESANLAMGDDANRPVLRAAGAVLGDLADLGFDAQWTTVAASTVGAPHRRERVFIVAYPAGHPWGLGDRNGGVAADDAGDRWHQGRPESDRRHQGRPESARIERRPDAAVGGGQPVELLPTPCAQQSGNTPENHLSKKPGRTKVTDLAILVENGLLATGGQLLPTPVVTDSVGAHNSTSGRQPGSQHHSGDTLGDVIYRGDLLPTPSVADGDGGHLNRSGERSGELLLPGVARAYSTGELLPTPTSRDHKGANQRGDETCLHGALLPTPEAKNAHAGPDYARMNREGSGGHDLVTAVAYHEVESSRWGRYAAAIERWESLTRPAPSPTEPNSKGNPRLHAPFAEWLMGWPAGWCTAAELGITRNEQLRIIGNGVVPQQAVAALYRLLTVSEVAA